MTTLDPIITTIGPHRVRHGSVMESLDPLVIRPASFFYSDPPWGQGNLNYWRTMNRKMTGQDVIQPDLATFLDRIFEVMVTYTTDDAVMFIEYGTRWAEEITRRAERHNLRILARSTPLYAAGGKMLPLHLYTMSKVTRGVPEGYTAAIDGTSGPATLRAAVIPYLPHDPTQYTVEPQIILDPCCGMGYTAQLAVENNLTFFGNELNAARLNKTIERLKRATQKGA